jgi:alanyl-tRNA synthetase
MLKEILADQTKTLLQQQAHSQEDFQQKLRSGQEEFRKDLQKDIMKELKAHQADLKQELQADFQAHQGTLRDDLTREIQQLNRSCVTQFQDVQQGLQTAERGIRELVVAQGGLESRLQALETRGSEAGTTATASLQGGPGGRRPALVLGGWDPDTAAADMLETAQKLIWELRLDVDVDDIFVPGV